MAHESTRARDIARLLTSTRALREELDRDILGTPTGATRNALCDANIFLMEAETHLRKAGMAMPIERAPSC